MVISKVIKEPEHMLIHPQSAGCKTTDTEKPNLESHNM